MPISILSRPIPLRIDKHDEVVGFSDLRQCRLEGNEHKYMKRIRAKLHTGYEVMKSPDIAAD